MSLVDKVKAYSKIGLMKVGIAVNETMASLDGAHLPDYKAENAGKDYEMHVETLIVSDRWIASRYRIISGIYHNIGNKKGAEKSVEQADSYEARARFFEARKKSF